MIQKTAKCSHGLPIHFGREICNFIFKKSGVTTLIKLSNIASLKVRQPNTMYVIVLDQMFKVNIFKSLYLIFSL